MEVKPPEDDTIQCLCWTRAHGDGDCEPMRIRPVAWSDIERNYPSATRRPLARLMTVDVKDRPSGRIVLFRGHVGTGKTHAIRALLTALSAWARVDVVADPQAAFGDSNYWLRLVSATTRDGRPRILVLEDVDSMLAGAHDDGFSRMLNLTDGLIGQDRDVVVVLSSNLSEDRIDPALLRPGRCLANVGFGKFEPAEARELLGAGGEAREALTLAEILERRGAISRIASDGTTQPVGMYL
jgi:hypothetical protein